MHPGGVGDQEAGLTGGEGAAGVQGHQGPGLDQTPDLQALGAHHQHARGGIAGDQVAAHQAVGAGVEGDVPGEGLEPPGDVQIQVRTGGGAAAVDGDTGVRQHPPGQVDGPGGRALAAEVHPRAAAEGLEVVEQPGAAGQGGEAEQIRVQRAGAEGEVVGALEDQPPIAQPDDDVRVHRVRGVRIVREVREGAAHRAGRVVGAGDGVAGGLQGRLYLGHEVLETRVVRIGRDRHAAAVGEAAALHRELQGDGVRQHPVGLRHPGVRRQLPGEGRGQQGQGTRGQELDGAPVAPGLEVGGAEQHQPLAGVVGGAVLGIRLDGVLPTLETDQATGPQLAADADLMRRLDDQAGIPAVGGEPAADGLAVRIAHGLDGPAREHGAGHLGIGAGDEAHAAVGGAGADGAGGGDLEPGAGGMGAAADGDPIAGDQGAAGLHRLALGVLGGAADAGPARGGDQDVRGPVGPVDGVADAGPAGEHRAQELEVPAAGDRHAPAAAVGAEPAGAEPARAAEHQGEPAVVRAGCATRGLHQPRGQHGPIDLQALAGLKRRAAALPGPGDAIGPGAAAAHQGAAGDEIAGGLHLYPARRLGGDEPRGALQIDAHPTAIDPAEAGPGQADAAEDPHQARREQLALAVDPGVGLHGEP